MLNPTIEKAYGILDGKEYNKSFFLELSKIKGADIMDLASLANKVKSKYAGDTHICTIMNAKSGICKENCKFCSQSSHHNSEIDRFPLVDNTTISEKAKLTYDSGVKFFGIVTSGTGYKEKTSEFNQIIDYIRIIQKKFPTINICASLGHLSDNTAKELAEHKISHYNLNIQTNPEKYSELISTTHNVNERIETIKLLKKHGIKICSGGIIGLGETMEDRIELAFTLKGLEVDVIPLNILIPIKGTPLENQKKINTSEIVKTFAIFRLIHPTKTIKFAAGRETVMKDFQSLIMLSGANGFLTGGYLTTRGREIEDDILFENELSSFAGQDNAT